MTIPTDYTELQAAIEGELARTDLTSDLPTFIDRGERLLNRKLRILSMETTITTLSLVSATRTIALPDGYLENISLRYNEDEFKPTFVTVDQLDESMSNTQTRPERYTIGSTIEFDAPSDATYAMTMRYFKKWDIATDDTNDLLTNEPDAYVLSGLVGSVIKTGESSRSQTWVKDLGLIIFDLNRVQGRTKRNREMNFDDAIVSQSRFNIIRGY